MSVRAADLKALTNAELELLTSPEPFIVPVDSVSMDTGKKARQAVRLGSLVQFPVQTGIGSTDEVLTAASSVASARAYRLVKRTLDIVVALVAIILLIPLALVVALSVWTSDPGPVVFTQIRCGKDGRRFRILKFRTMLIDAEEILKRDAELANQMMTDWKIRNDPRVTKVGRVLRKTSLDELPQLVNVLRGDMSLVGPRPVTPDEYDVNYARHGQDVFSVEPGITGLWQASGRSNLSYEDRVALDLEYVRSRCFWLDVSIIVKTVPAVLLSRGAR